VLHLEVGQPSAGAPTSARAAAQRALDSGSPLGYTNAAGWEPLRRRIVQHHADRHGASVPVARVMVVAGASAGFTLAFLAAFDAGARVGVLEPGYPCYRNTLQALGMEPVPIPVGPETRWAPTNALLDAAGPLDGLVIASPSNPTGTVLEPAARAALVERCRRDRIRLIVDEIYDGITYGEPTGSVLTDTAEAVVVNSFSKYFCMTGWRVGWVVVPDDLVDTVERLQQNLYICASAIGQIAACAAFDDAAELDAHVHRYAANRRLLLDGLAAAGITSVADADGAFYVYADVGDLIAAHGIPGTQALATTWLHELGVAVTPGLDFDLARGQRFVRFSYAGATETVAAACRALQGWCAR
jgi:aspartate/methionine/tyrosine aminotransferase